ncbi:hypothetical protein ACFQ4Z_03015 [Oceanobacillus oncorhynchi subsp. oncorhynchi]|uniref:hypothetical protein n=1 Tax=Oceanobacillus oncorhynchi TaxID=545501 RepID=UPI003642ACC8
MSSKKPERLYNKHLLMILIIKLRKGVGTQAKSKRRGKITMSVFWTLSQDKTE